MIAGGGQNYSYAIGRIDCGRPRSSQRLPQLIVGLTGPVNSCGLPRDLRECLFTDFGVDTCSLCCFHFRARPDSDTQTNWQTQLQAAGYSRHG